MKYVAIKIFVSFLSFWVNVHLTQTKLNNPTGDNSVKETHTTIYGYIIPWMHSTVCMKTSAKFITVNDKCNSLGLIL